MKQLKSLFQVIAVFILVFNFAHISDAQSRNDRIVIREAERISNDSFRVSTKTPNGAKIYAVSQPSKKMLAAIDQGLQDLFDVAEKNNYTKRLSFSDYTIFIAKADRTADFNKNYSPDIAVAANQYAGSVYDKGGYIYAAGIVVAYNPCAFMIAEHTKKLSRVSEVVRYEGEHLVLYHNDRRRFKDTADHSNSGGHPILNR